MSDPTGFEDAAHIAIDQLLLDPENPRLKSEMAEDDPSQSELAARLADVEDALVIAKSIARHGFYPWEVLVVVPSDDGHYTVVEGNRRLTALRGLSHPETRALFNDRDDWEQLAQSVEGWVPPEVPCVVVESRAEAQPALGYRHISGIEPWKPAAQARFIAHLIESEGRSEEEVSELTGKSVSWVRNTYRNHLVVRQAADWGIDTAEMEESFSLVDGALSSPDIREYLGIPRRSVEAAPNYAPVPEENRDRLGEVVGLIWGSDTIEPAVSDSRQIRRLGRIIRTEDGREALLAGRTIEEAAAIADESVYDPVDVALGSVRKATSAAKATQRELEKASLQGPIGPEVHDAIGEFADEAAQVIQFVDSAD